MSDEPRPYTLVAELTYRCPLRCVYCSNPVDFARHGDGLDTADWCRIFREAEDLGVVQLNLVLHGAQPGFIGHPDDLAALMLEQKADEQRRINLSHLIPDCVDVFPYQPEASARPTLADASPYQPEASARTTLADASGW